MNFYVMNNTEWPVSDKFVKWLLEQIAAALPSHKKELKRQIGVVVADRAQMSELNQKYRKKKGVTDVLSFAAEGEMLGDVVICQEVLSKQAKDHGLDDSEEFAYLVLHGVLHLLGYDHETSAADAKKMFAIQDKIFEVLMDQDIFKTYRKLNK